MSRRTEKEPELERAQARRTRAHRTTYAQNFILTWLDSAIDESQDDFQRSLEKLRRIVTHIDTITDPDPDRFLQLLNQNASVQVFLIVSGSLGQSIISNIHDQSNLDTIFVFCANQERHRQWARKWPKIAGVFTDIDELCHALKHHAQLCDRNASSFTVTTADLQHLPPSFMYTQLVKEILIEMDFDGKAMNELAVFCRDIYQKSARDLAMIDEFERDYGDHSPVWWYTREGFTYSLLNRALRTQDMEVLIKMGFFLRDVHRRIEKLHAEHQHWKKTFIVYRGQGMHGEEFKNIQRSEGGLLAFNNFLSTSRDRAVSMNFARESLDKPSHVAVLFSMTIDPSISGTPFASLDGESFLEESEAEVLFSMHTVFRLGKTAQIEDAIWQVDLVLMNDEEDRALKELTESMSRSTSGGSGWHQLARLLLQTGEYTKAQAIYDVLLDETAVSDDKERSHLYHQLGYIADSLGFHQEALEYYHKSLQIDLKSLPDNHPDLATSYNNIGIVHDSMGEYSKALEYHHKSLQIKLKSLPDNHPHLAITYSNIGAALDGNGRYEEAFEYHKKSIEISQARLPSWHTYLAIMYRKMGTICCHSKKYTLSIDLYKKAIKIYKASANINKIGLALVYSRMGEVQDCMGNHTKVVEFCSKARSIQETHLPENHPDTAFTINTLGLAERHLGSLKKSLDYHEKALKMLSITLPASHPDIAWTHSGIAAVYDKMGDRKKASESIEKAIGIAENSLPCDHPHLQLYRETFTALKKA